MENLRGEGGDGKARVNAAKAKGDRMIGSRMAGTRYKRSLNNAYARQAFEKPRQT